MGKGTHTFRVVHFQKVPIVKGVLEKEIGWVITKTLKIKTITGRVERSLSQNFITGKNPEERRKRMKILNGRGKIGRGDVEENKGTLNGLTRYTPLV